VAVLAVLLAVADSAADLAVADFLAVEAVEVGNSQSSWE
jgi:hypothetical protein